MIEVNRMDDFNCNLSLVIKTLILKKSIVIKTCF